MTNGSLLGTLSLRAGVYTSVKVAMRITRCHRRAAKVLINTVNIFGLIPDTLVPLNSLYE